jgi:Zn ribbon nucleic-acid-binding protein
MSVCLSDRVLPGDGQDFLWQAYRVAEQGGLPFEEREELRKEEAKWWIAHSREVLAAGGHRYIARQPCNACETADAVLYPRGGQNTVLCSECGRLLYNAPKTETGEAPRTVKTLRTQMRPSQQARILDRDHARCVLCGRGDQMLTIGHLLSIEDGARIGATALELNDDLNLAAMCDHAPPDPRKRQ